jgi:hypothetical protein
MLLSHPLRNLGAMTYAPVELQAPPAPDRARFVVRLLAAACTVLLFVGVAGLAVVEPQDEIAAAASGSPADVVASAVAKTAQVNSLRIESNTAIAPVPFGNGTVAARGAYDLAAKRAEFSLKMGDLAFEGITDGDTVYFKAPVPGLARPWILIDAATLANSPFGGSVPSGRLRDLGALGVLGEPGVIKSVTRKGPSEVRGTPTRSYAVEVDIRAVMAALSGPAALPADAPVTFDDTVLDLHVDGDGLVRRLVMRFGGRVPGGATSESFSITSESDFSDFDAPVRVTVPPASEVLRVESFQELIGAFGGMR